ncbi:uncharacterized protein PG986_008718 [Apiospora aurea]|uniref:Heterokaryon incompatibility domain-containing protein n=1 Tax=Apiospora aurea TaxID=335848 RepID=A0ABR1Q6C0_9PEZI
MDHIQQPPDPLYAPIQVPRLDATPYDGQDFDGYPARQGWDESLLMVGHFSQFPAAATAALLQNWLYFGVLDEILGDLGAKANYSEHGQVTTAKLDANLSTCMELLKDNLRNGLQEARDRLARIQHALEQLSYFCSHTTVAGDIEDPAVSIWPLPAEVDFSLRVLGSYMSAGIFATLWHVQYDPFFTTLRFGGGQLPQSRMVAAGWCPSDTSMALEQLSPAAQYHASSLKRTVVRDHSSCSSEACVTSQVNTSAYTTKHTEDSCDCVSSGPPVEELLAIFDSGRVPLLTMKKEEDGITFRVRAYRPGCRYVAFSHVWSDGLGNPLRNQFPMCQVTRIWLLLDELDRLTSTLSLVNKGHASRLWGRQRGVSVPFWIDTLCIPVGPQYEFQRSRAIALMKDTYANAYQVLVLDAELEAVPMGDTTEMMMRISLSGWMRRLWTLQEGVLATRMYVKFKDGILDVACAKTELDNCEVPSGVTPGLTATYGTVPNQAARFYVSMSALRRDVLRLERGYEPKLFGRRREYIHYDDEKVKRGRMGSAVMEAFIASRYRTTSRQADEYICLASLLGWDTSGLSSVPANQRMKYLHSKQETLPQGILFASGPRMEEVGWRWAVTRFGHSRTHHRLSAPINDFTLAHRRDEGLTIAYPGFILPSSYEQKSVVKTVRVLADRAEQGRMRVKVFEMTLLEDGQYVASDEYNALRCVL